MSNKTNIPKLPIRLSGIIMAVAMAIFTFFAMFSGSGFSRLFYLMIGVPLWLTILVVLINLNASRYFSRSKAIKICTIIFNLAYIVSWACLEDSYYSGGQAVFGLISPVSDELSLFLHNAESISTTVAFALVIALIVLMIKAKKKYIAEMTEKDDENVEHIDFVQETPSIYPDATAPQYGKSEEKPENEDNVAS